MERLDAWVTRITTCVTTRGRRKRLMKVTEEEYRALKKRDMTPPLFQSLRHKFRAVLSESDGI